MKEKKRRRKRMNECWEREREQDRKKGKHLVRTEQHRKSHQVYVRASEWYEFFSETVSTDWMTWIPERRTRKSTEKPLNEMYPLLPFFSLSLFLSFSLISIRTTTVSNQEQGLKRETETDARCPHRKKSRKRSRLWYKCKRQRKWNWENRRWKREEERKKCRVVDFDRESAAFADFSLPFPFNILPSLFSLVQFRFLVSPFISIHINLDIDWMCECL